MMVRMESGYSCAAEKAMPFAWESLDGESSMALAWEVPAPRAVMIGVHGLSGAAEQFSPLGHALPRVSLYAVELRGQGNDSNPARRGAILDVPSQLRALDLFIEVVRRKAPGVPIFLLGESYPSCHFEAV